MARHRQTFEEFEKEIQKELGEDIEEIILFGSVARGEEREQSDIDVLIITKDRIDKKTLKERAREIAYDKTLETGIYLSIKVLREKEVENLKTSGSNFIRDITSQGEIVHA